MYGLKKSIAAITIAGLGIMNVYAQTADSDTFQKLCVKYWMQGAANVEDKVNFKNFGEKYCGCAKGKNLDTKEQMDKAAQQCVSQTLLHLSMDSVEEEKGLNDLTVDQIKTGCIDEWKSLYPTMNDKKAASINSYCQCSSPKLMDLVKDKDKYTDKEWYEKIDAIADSCAGNVEPDQSAAQAQQEKQSSSSTPTESTPENTDTSGVDNSSSE